MAEVITMPKLGFDMAEGTLVRWLIAENESVEKGQILAEIETDKATVEVESAHSGVVRHHLVKEGDVLPVGVPIAVIGEADEEIDLGALVSELEAEEEPIAPPAEPVAEAAAKMLAAETAPPAVPVTEAEGYPGGVKVSPVARRMVEEHGLDITAIRGTGPGGRIIKRDIEAFLSRPPAPTEEPAPPPSVAAPVPAFTPLGSPPPDQVVQVNKLRAAIGRRMVESKQRVPHFYVTHEYDMGPVMALRKQINAMLEGSGEKLSVNDFIVKATALALREYPNLNASLKGDPVVRHGQVNVGVAVAVEGGLLTVVTRETDRKSLRQISDETREMVGRARQGKVRPDDIEGSTFSVSNMGMYDVEHFIAIINPPEAAILAVGSALQVPVVQDGEVVPGWRMKATISVDHRVSDGVEAAQFLQALAVYLEEPVRLLI
jgi:pyruvate dehydrogenase E2 component (dihydrolipoamide acetyltransferase)